MKTEFRKVRRKPRRINQLNLAAETAPSVGVRSHGDVGLKRASRAGRCGRTVGTRKRGRVSKVAASAKQGPSLFIFNGALRPPKRHACEALGPRVLA